jgi:hypothetical protein
MNGFRYMTAATWIWIWTIFVELNLSAAASTFSTQSTPALKFLLLGDWGKGGNSGYYSSHLSTGDETNERDDDHNRRATKEATYQASIAKAMSNYSNTFNPSFVVALGDNFYGNGVSSTTDPYWDYLWTQVYLDDYPSLRIPWFAVLG